MPEADAARVTFICKQPVQASLHWLFVELLCDEPSVIPLSNGVSSDVLSTTLNVLLNRANANAWIGLAGDRTGVAFDPSWFLKTLDGPRSCRQSLPAFAAISNIPVGHNGVTDWGRPVRHPAAPQQLVTVSPACIAKCRDSILAACRKRSCALTAAEKPLAKSLGDVCPTLRGRVAIC